MIYDISVPCPLDDHPVAFKFELDRRNRNEAFIMDFFQKGLLYEPEISWFMLRAIKPGDFVVDVGANIGVFTVLMSKMAGPNGLVLAFEPDADNLSCLKNNLRINNISNVEIVERPLWIREEEIRLYECKDTTGSHALWDVSLWPGNELTRHDGVKSKAFMACTLEKELARTGRRCAFIKLDTEGVDEPILKSLGSQRPDYIVSELNPFGMLQVGSDNDTMRTLMSSYGYDCFFIHRDDRLPSLVPAGSKLMNGPNGCIVMNMLFSTLDKVSEAYPYVSSINKWDFLKKDAVK
jgi:FkbM family methyltransferase